MPKDYSSTLEERKNNFLFRCEMAHGKKFDYTNFIYVNAHTKGIIKCSMHGEFSQSPTSHLEKGSKGGCPKCFSNLIKSLPSKKGLRCRPVFSKEVFLERAKNKYGNKFIYDLSNYDGMTTNLISIVCPFHGPFSSFPFAHISKEMKFGCTKCAIEDASKRYSQTYDEFLRKARLKYSNKYEYLETNEINFKNSYSTVSIECEKHGLFFISADYHLQGGYCPKCTQLDLILNNKKVGVYSHRLFRMFPDLKPLSAFLYYLKIDNGRLYKIGITKDLDNRLNGIKSSAKHDSKVIEIIAAFPMSLYEAFVLEQRILKQNKDSRVIKTWTTELFNIDVYDRLCECIKQHYRNEEIKGQKCLESGETMGANYPVFVQPPISEIRARINKDIEKTLAKTI